MRALLRLLGPLAGIGKDSSGHLEKWVATAGGLVGLVGVLLISEAQLGLGNAAGLVASMGASAVLLFAVPHGPLSQPWSVFGGDAVHQLGFQFVLTPVMLNAVTILLVALLFNAPFAWRRYPAALASINASRQAARADEPGEA